jgi:hypothetical protein
MTALGAFVIIARESAGSSQWRKASLTASGQYSMSAGVPGVLFSLVDAFINGPIGACDLTVSTQPIDDLMNKPPDQLSIPSDYGCTLLLPIGREGNEEAWTTLQKLPGHDNFLVVAGGNFQKPTLSVQLEKIFGSPHLPRDSFQRIWTPAHAKRMVWIRHVNGGVISGHRGGVKPGQLCCWRLKQKAPFAKGAFCFSAFV